ncbi:MAG: glycosyltransferase [Prevotella sp.]
MKILFYADTVFSFGGVQRVLAVVSKALSVDHDVTILTIDHAEDKKMYDYRLSTVKFDYISYESPHDVQYCLSKACSFVYKRLLPKNGLSARLYDKSFFLPRYKKLLAKKINAGGYDVVVGVHAFLSLHLASVRNRLNVPLTVGWMHNSYDALFEKQNPYLPGLKSFFGHEMRRLDKIVVLTKADAELFKSKLGLNSNVLYNPLTLKPRGIASFSYRKFLAVGRFSPLHKGFDILLNAFAQFAKTNSDWTLEIVGEGDEEPLYREIIAKERLQQRVHICPFTTDIQGHYSKASVFVLSSRWEGQPLVLVEAMAHGLPVISSDIPVACELLSDNGASVMFKNGDSSQLAAAMEQMATTKDWDQMSQKAMEFSHGFDVEETCCKWNDIFIVK